jgi:tripartite ATP-independent transporter DctM subunit
MGPAIPREELDQIPVPKRILDAVKYALPPSCLIFAILGALFFGIATPTEAAGVGSAVSFLMIILYGRFSWRNFKDTIFSTGRTVTMVITILIGATTFTGVFLTQGGGKAMVDAIIGLGLGPMGTYWMMQVIYIILGCFIDWIGIIMITFPIFLPIAKALGFDTLWFTTMLAINLQISFLTPPFGYALFYLSGMGLEGVKLNHIYRGVMPFLVLQFLGVVLCTYWPEVVVWLPNAMIGK